MDNGIEKKLPVIMYIEAVKRLGSCTKFSSVGGSGTRIPGYKPNQDSGQDQGCKWGNIPM